EVGLRVEARVAGGALRPDEALLLVLAQRLRMHADELGGDGDHVARAVVDHQLPAFFSSSSSSRCFLLSFFGTLSFTRARTSPLPEPFSFGAPLPVRRGRVA